MQHLKVIIFLQPFERSNHFIGSFWLEKQGTEKEIRKSQSQPTENGEQISKQ